MRSSIPSLTLALLVGGCASAPRQLEPTLEQKLARLIQLEDARSLGEGEVFARLVDQTPRVRRRAALSLARIGDPQAAGPLTAALSDPEAEVREMAAFALGLLDGPLPAESLEALRSGTVDPSQEVRARCMEALGRKAQGEARSVMAEPIGTVLSGEVRELPTPPPFEWGEDIQRSAIRLPHEDLRLGLYALARLESLRWAWSTLATEDGRARFLWWPAAWVTAELAAEESRPVLLDYASSTDPFIRLLAARGLGRLSPATVGNAVLQLLGDVDEKVRIEAARAASKLGLAQAAPRLLQMMESDTPYGQVEAIRALAGLPPDPGVVDPLIDRLADPDPWVRAAVLRALAFQDPDGFWLLLSGLGSDPDWRVRRDLARLMGEMGGARAAGVLEDLAGDRDFRVRRHALLALVDAAPPKAAPLLLDHLNAEDPFERAAAAEGLSKLRPPDAVVRLEEAFARSAGDTVPDARLSILSAVAAYGREAVEPLAREALEDRFWLVRRRGAWILSSLDDQTVFFRGPDSDLTIDDYTAMLRPRYTPQAFIRTEKGPIEVELFVLDAPVTAFRFMGLARKGFYDGLTFHRVVPNEVVEAGDPRGDSMGGPGFHLRTEVSQRPVMRGTVLMAQDGKDTAGSRFLITHLPRPDLAGRYTVLGQVTGGMDVVDRLEPGDVIRELVIWDGETMGQGGTPDAPTSDKEP